MLLTLLTSLFLFSCQKSEDLLTTQQVPPQEAPLVSATTGLSSSNLIYEENFEGSNVFGDYVSKLQVGTPYGFTVVNSPVFEGSKAGRFELRDTDPLTSSGTRAEVLFNPLVNPHRWYSFSTMFPSATYKIDNSFEIITQFHQGGGESPSISLLTKDDKLTLEVRPNPGEKLRWVLTPLVKDVWHTYVMNINHSHGSDGLIEIWQDGVKLFSRSGPNSYDFATYDKPKWKLGLYKWDWNGTSTTNTNIRVLYFDNVRLGNENATYNNMVSSGTTPTTPPPTSNTAPTVSITSPANNASFTAPASINVSASAADADGTVSSVSFYNGSVLLGSDNSSPYSFAWNNVAAGNYSITAKATDNSGAVTTSSPVSVSVAAAPISGITISSYTLINSETERDIMTINDGATISFNQIGTHKLNIRANTSSTVDRVDFVLSGTQSRTFSDNATPYALMGDSGAGNYYYGNWNPPALGSYTLKATPVRGTQVTVPKTISFTFVQ